MAGMFTGLTDDDVQGLVKRHGYNELPAAKPKSIWRIAREVMKEPMFSLLIACAILYMLLGDYREGAIMLASIFVIIFITFYQYQRTERALEALRELSSPRALVIRNGALIRIPGREVVPGDILQLNEGDRIAADAQLLESLHLSVDESLLTGESVPVQKQTSGENAQRTMLFSGTLVVQGEGWARVTATGTQTEFGKIGMSLQAIHEEDTRLQKEMKILIRNLFAIGILCSIGVVIAYYITRGNIIQSLLQGFAATMAMLPEEFPVVLMVFLALGSWRLSRSKVLTRKPSAIETLGSATVLCSDKTGTITQNKMSVAALFTGKRFLEAHEFEHNQTAVSSLLHVASHASNPAPVDPMEKAIRELALKLRVDTTDHELIRAYPLSNRLFAMTRVTRNAAGTQLISAKGAPEAIMSMCTMQADEQNEYHEAIHRMAGEGYRVIAVAEAEHTGDLPPEQSHFAMSMLGLIGLQDPVREEVPASVRECTTAGIRVVMITGDYPETAQSIARQSGMPEPIHLLNGEAIDAMDDNTLRDAMKQVSVCARVIPRQKLRIVEALKANGDIVAMTGDGVNDAPALKAADIGIAMGNKGTDVAREASSLVLLDDNFTSIVRAIRLGRRIYDNLQKAMSYIMAIHLPILGLTLLPCFFPSLPVLLMPLHIVMMELIIDPVSSVAFETEKEEKGIMQRPPRDPGKKFFGIRHILFSLFQGSLLLLMVLAVYFLSLQEGHTRGEVRAIAFSSLIIGNIFLVIANLSASRSFLAVLLEKNKAALLIFSLALGLLAVVLFVPAMRTLFYFDNPGYRHFLVSLIGALLMLFILEVIKWFRQT